MKQAIGKYLTMRPYHLAILDYYGWKQRRRINAVLRDMIELLAATDKNFDPLDYCQFLADYFALDN